MVVFDIVVGLWFKWCGVDCVDDGECIYGMFIVELYMFYLCELEFEEFFLVIVQLFVFEGKKIYIFLCMYCVCGDESVGELVVMNEILLFFVDLGVCCLVDLLVLVVDQMVCVLEWYVVYGVFLQSGCIVGIDVLRLFC